MIKNNITRLLEAKNIPYTVYELPGGKLGAVQVAEFLNAPLEQVFKTIVVLRLQWGKPILAVVPGNSEVDLKSLAKSLGEKKVRLPSQAEAERLTQLKAGGISPLALLNRGFRTVLDESAMQHREIYISGGQRTLDIRLPVSDFIKLTEAKIANIASSP